MKLINNIIASDMTFRGENGLVVNCATTLILYIVRLFLSEKLLLHLLKF